MVSCLCIRCVFLFFVCKSFHVYHADTRGKEMFLSRMENIGIDEPDE